MKTLAMILARIASKGVSLKNIAASKCELMIHLAIDEDLEEILGILWKMWLEIEIAKNGHVFACLR